jgi:hypothetical protein
MADNTITLTVGGSLNLVLRPATEGYAIVTARYDSFIVKSKGNQVAYTLPVDHYIEVQVSYVDAHGNPALIDGLVSWASSDSTMANVAVDATDSTLCTITPVGPAGSAQVTATADVDLGAGVKPLITTLDVTLVAGSAVAGQINVVGSPQPIVP